MKRKNSNFKILTKKETSHVKGGGWISNMLSAWYNKYQADRSFGSASLMAADDCPPPEPDND